MHVGEGKHLFSAGQGANSAATVETAVEVLQEAKKKVVNLQYGLPMPLMGVYICPKDCYCSKDIYCSKDTCYPCSLRLFSQQPGNKQPRFPLTDE